MNNKLHIANQLQAVADQLQKEALGEIVEKIREIISRVNWQFSESTLRSIWVQAVQAAASRTEWRAVPELEALRQEIGDPQLHLILSKLDQPRIQTHESAFAGGGISRCYSLEFNSVEEIFDVISKEALLGQLQYFADSRQRIISKLEKDIKIQREHSDELLKIIKKLDVSVENNLSLEYIAFHLPSYFTWRILIRPETKYWDVIGRRKEVSDATRQIIKLGLDPQVLSNWTKLLEYHYGVFCTGLEPNPMKDMTMLEALNTAKEAKAGDPETCFLRLQFPREKALQFLMRQDVEIGEVSMPCSTNRFVTDANNFEWNDAHTYAFAAFTFLSACKVNSSLKIGNHGLERESWMLSNILSTQLGITIRRVFMDTFGNL